ncbi:MAG: DMT family transporter [Acidimicrobiia bacterium]|nr:DMT family transporter [Acidimicrobiia bacterium]
MDADRTQYAALGGLTVAAFLFGVTFVVVKAAVETVDPLAFVGWRFLIGGLALLLLAIPRTNGVWRDGVIAGTWLFAGYGLQTGGLTLTGATNSALITGLYVVFVPLLAAVVRRRSPSPWAVVGVVLGFIGTALLTVRDDLTLGAGDLLTVGCAVAFAGHIVTIARQAPRHPVIPYTTVQLLTTAALGLGGSLVFEGPGLPDSSGWPAIILTGLGVSAIAYLLQVWAQNQVGPSRTAILLTLEPVFAVVAAAIVLSERLTAAGWFGAAIILGAIGLVLRKVDDDPLVEAEAISPV